MKHEVPSSQDGWIDAMQGPDRTVVFNDGPRAPKDIMIYEQNLTGTR